MISEIITMPEQNRILDIKIIVNLRMQIALYPKSGAWDDVRMTLSLPPIARLFGSHRFSSWAVHQIDLLNPFAVSLVKFSCALRHNLCRAGLIFRGENYTHLPIFCVVEGSCIIWIFRVHWLQIEMKFNKLVSFHLKPKNVIYIHCSSFAFNFVLTKNEL